MLRPSTTSSWLGLLALTACGATPPPLDLPAAPPQVQYLAVVGPATLPAALAVAVERFAVRPGLAGPAIDLATDTIATDRGLPFRGASSLPAGSRWLDADRLTEWRTGTSERQSRGIADAVVAFDLHPHILAGPGLPELELQPTAAGAVQVIVIVRAEDGSQERLVLQPPVPSGAAGLLFVPVPPNAGYAGDAVLVTVMGPAAPALTTALRAAHATAPAVAPAPADWRLAQRAIGEHSRRPALLALARERASARCLDLLLVADEAALITITAQLALVPDQQITGPWPFERAVLQALLPRLERDELGPALQAGLRRQLGALANDVGTLRALLAESADTGQFARGLRDENLAALADRAAAPRVTAHDWLQQHGGSVSGYDPLASAPVRRSVLRANAAAASLPTESKQ